MTYHASPQAGPAAPPRFFKRRPPPLLFGVFLADLLVLSLFLAFLKIPNLLPLLYRLPEIQARFQGAPPARLLLEGYQFWYLAMILFFGVLLLSYVLFLARLLPLAARRTPRPDSARGLFLTSFSLPLLVVGLWGALLSVEKIPTLFFQTVEDIRQLEAGTWEEAVVWLSPKSRPYRLPGPYSDGLATPVTRYGGINWETGGAWEAFFFPNDMEFALDPDFLFDETRSIDWNQENAVQYRLAYTTHFHLVVSADPLPLPTSPDQEEYAYDDSP